MLRVRDGRPDCNQTHVGRPAGGSGVETDRSGLSAPAQTLIAMHVRAADEEEATNKELSSLRVALLSSLRETFPSLETSTRGNMILL